MRIDLHVHSNSSKHPNEWILRQLGAQECYTPPEEVYRIAKARGMDAVTITDHNSIDGCLAIAHHPDTFVSCEYTTYFPDDGCKAHVVCYNITPEQHQRIQEVRSNIFELAAFLKRHRIVHTLAHALFGPNSKLTPEHFQHFLRLFDTWEINGAKDFWANHCLKLILDAVKPDHKVTAGSDDHSGLTIAHAWTEVAGAGSIKEFFDGVVEGKTIIGEKKSTPHTLAWNIYSVGWQWLKHTNVVNGSLSILDRYLLAPEVQKNRSLGKGWLNSLVVSPRYWAREIAVAAIGREFEKADNGSFNYLPDCERWFHLMDAITSKHIVKLGNKMINELAARNYHSLFSNTGLPFALYALLAPFFAAFGKYASQRALGRELLQRYGLKEIQPIKVAKFTDTFGTVDGVSRTLDEQLREAVRTGKDYTIISCVGENSRCGLKVFPPLGMIDTPEFEQQKLCWPPILKILDYCYTEQFTHIQASTPGPVGLAAMITAKTLGLPFQAVYHTHIPEFVGKVTDDPFMEELCRKYCLWFYDSADVIFTPSEHTRSYLAKHGLRREKIKVYPRGVDTSFFTPDRRTDYWRRKWGTADGTIKALYVGRVSKEKNLPLLVEAFKNVADGMKPPNAAAVAPNIRLLVVGDGAYFEEMKRECDGYPVTFTGELHGEELAEAFASADLFVFPSTTDTFGRVVLEAMASGIPCIVSDVGGPKENIIHGFNGLIVPGDNAAALSEAITILTCTMDREKMGKEAREFTETKSLSGAFDQYWSLYAA
ncbi:MAG TPA: glycosyltransferase [Desulfomonilaceae bacterium]|nr:glycosyltransferase [Desulfomonilaceae bacterium]